MLQESKAQKSRCEDGTQTYNAVCIVQRVEREALGVMLKKYCDRCLKEIDEIKSEMTSISNGNNTVYYDLCERCHAEMWECLLKKKAEVV